MTGHFRPQKSLLLSLLFLTAALLTAACSASHRPPSGTGDPGNHRLHQLQSERIITLPTGATPSGSIRWFPAIWLAGQGYWHSPNFTWGFSDKASHKEVIDSYDLLASQSGWLVAPNSSVTPFGRSWVKTYPGGYQADITLQDGFDLINKKTGPSQYTLFGMIDVPEPGKT